MNHEHYNHVLPAIAQLICATLRFLKAMRVCQGKVGTNFQDIQTKTMTYNIIPIPVFCTMF